MADKHEPGLAIAILDKHGPGKHGGAEHEEEDELGGQKMDLKMMFKALGVSVGPSPNWSKAVEAFNEFVSKCPPMEAMEEGEEEEPDEHDEGDHAY